MRKVFNILGVKPSFSIDLKWAFDDEFDFVDRNVASTFVQELKEIECQTPKFRRRSLAFERSTLAGF
jgi:hypothetical protein